VVDEGKGRVMEEKIPVQATTVLSDIPARLDRLPWSGFHRKIVLILGIAFVLDGFEVSVYGSVLGTLAKLWNMSAIQASSLMSIFLIGMFVGAYVFGYLTDILGRKRLFVVTLLVYSVFTVASALSWNYASLAVFRFVTGFGVGGEYGAVNSAIQEFVPSRRRGFVSGLMPATWDAGTILAALVSTFALALLPPEVGWRVAFLLGALIAVFVAIVRRHLPESPRWLLSHGRADEAEAVATRIEKVVQSEQGLTKLPPPGGSAPISSAQPTSFFAHYGNLIRRYPRQVVLAWVLNFSQAFPYYAAFTLIPVILINTYHYDPKSVPLVLMFLTTLGTVGVVVMSWVADTWGRRASVILSYGLAGLLAMVVGIGASQGLLTAGLFSVLVAVMYFFAFAAAGVVYITITEIFPTPVRASGIGSAVAFGRIGAMIGPILLTAMLQVGMTLAFLVTGAILLVGALVEVAWGIEGRGRSLEAIALGK
jgi:MFS family permease